MTNNLYTLSQLFQYSTTSSLGIVGRGNHFEDWGQNLGVKSVHLSLYEIREKIHESLNCLFRSSAKLRSRKLIEMFTLCNFPNNMVDYRGSKDCHNLITMHVERFLVETENRMGPSLGPREIVWLNTNLIYTRVFDRMDALRWEEQRAGLPQRSKYVFSLHNAIERFLDHSPDSPQAETLLGIICAFLLITRANYLYNILNNLDTESAHQFLRTYKAPFFIQQKNNYIYIHPGNEYEDSFPGRLRPAQKNDFFKLF